MCRTFRKVPDFAPLMSLTVEQDTNPLLSLAPQPLKVRDFKVCQEGRAEWSSRPRHRLDFLSCEGGAVIGTVCTFPPSSWDLGRPGKVPKVKTEATHCISQWPHLDIFSNLDMP